MFLSDSSLLQTHVLKSIDSRFQNLCGWTDSNSIGRSPCLPLMRKVAKPQVLSEGEITHPSNYCWFCGMGFSPSVTFGASPQSLIEPSAVCLKADRQTILVCRLAMLAPSSEGARETANCASHPIKLKRHSIYQRTAEPSSSSVDPLIPYFPVIRFANSSTPLPTSASEFSDVSILRISSLVAS